MKQARNRSVVNIIFSAIVLLAVQRALAQLEAPSVKVSGEVTTVLKLTMADLSKMHRVTVTLNDKDGKAHPYTGVAITEILQQAGVPSGKQLRGANLTKYMVARCADGYKVLFSLAELDGDFTDRVVILADEIEGKPLSAERGPFRLIVPGEKKPARSSYQVQELIIGSVKD